MIVVLRLGHRRVRDARVTTHVCLTARAFGASEVWVDAEDRELERVVDGVVARFGGPFKIRTGVAWKKELRAFRGTKVHLTMYGLLLDEALPAISKAARGKDVMLIVGASKVPGEVFGLADFNVAVGSHPHSEVAALAIALDRLTRSGWARTKFKGASVAVRPHARRKDVVKLNKGKGPASEEE